MLIEFDLKPDWDVEEGYRHLKIFIFGGGSNYISVVAKLDWTVIRNEWINGDDGLVEGKDYIQGETDWLYFSYHDSCWRSDGVEKLLWKFRDRILGLRTDFTNWYQVVDIGDKNMWRKPRDQRYNSHEFKTLEEQEFHFEKES